MQRLTETQQGLIVHHLLNQSVNVGRRLFYDQHTYWIDFSRFVPCEQARRVAYINVVREPVARFGSAGTFFGHEQSAGLLKAFPPRLQLAASFYISLPPSHVPRARIRP